MIRFGFWSEMGLGSGLRLTFDRGKTTVRIAVKYK